MTRPASSARAALLAAVVLSPLVPPAVDAAAPPGRYSVTATTVLDNETGLMWQRAEVSSSLNWQQALAYCEGLSLASHSDWRLPSVKELFTIADDTENTPSIDPIAFPGTTSGSFWSSTPFAGPLVDGNPGQVFEWAVAFVSGGVSLPIWGGSSQGGNLLRVRCVR